jgi:hypothetical protein
MWDLQKTGRVSRHQREGSFRHQLTNLMSLGMGPEGKQVPGWKGRSFITLQSEKAAASPEEL